MPRRMWTYDVAREQNPTRDHLFDLAALSLDAGYDALGLYLEHRFAYASAPWARGVGVLTPELVQDVRREFPSLRLVPFVNLLGHMEGFLYTEVGAPFAEERFRGLQACPLAPGFDRFCRGLIEDVLAAFDDELVHIGGDETSQLGRCPRCAEAVMAFEREDPEGKRDGRAQLYADHFAPLAAHLRERGRRPAVWGDMLLAHPAAMSAFDRSTLVFDWQYQTGLKDSAPRLREAGFDVIGCPTLHVYNAAWCHLELSEQNIREVSQDVRDLGLSGVCLTTWECGLFGAYDTLFPAIQAARLLMDEPDAPMALDDSDWGQLMGVELERLGGVFGFSGRRSALKCRFMLYRNPFLLWLHHSEELCGERGDAALALCERALAATDNEGRKGVTLFVRGAIEFTRLAEGARLEYAAGRPEAAIAKLASTRMIFDHLETVARRSLQRIGGSRADGERARLARNHIEQVIRNIREVGQGEMGYLPAWEIVTHPKFVPHDQANWWLVNAWANE